MKDRRQHHFFFISPDRPDGRLIPGNPVPDKEEERGPRLATVWQVPGVNLFTGDAAQQAKIRPDKQLNFRVEFAPGERREPRSGALPPPGLPSAADWGLIRWLVSSREGAVSVGGITFQLTSVPPLPAQRDWPRRADFGLEE